MSAHAAFMPVVHGGLLRTSECASVRHNHKPRLGHIFGEGNVWADAESRGYDGSLAALSAQLGVTPSDAPVPPHAIALLNRVRSAIRNRPLTEGEQLRTSKKAYSEGYTGHGPVSLAVFAGRVALPPSALALQTQGGRVAELAAQYAVPAGFGAPPVPAARVDATTTTNSFTAGRRIRTGPIWGVAAAVGSTSPSGCRRAAAVPRTDATRGRPARASVAGGVCRSACQPTVVFLLAGI